MVNIQTVVCLNCFTKTNKSFPICGSCGKTWAVKGVGKQTSPPPARPVSFRFGEQQVQ
jgi:hypothetical protein